MSLITAELYPCKDTFRLKVKNINISHDYTTFTVQQEKCVKVAAENR